MTLTPGLTSARDLFDKLQRDASLLDEEVTSDRFFNFVITGYSLIDWVKSDPSVPSGAKTVNVIRSLYDDHWLKICGDLANSSKHFSLNRRRPTVSSANSMQGYGVGRYGKGGYSVGEESIDLQLNDGTRFDCLDFVSGVLSAWQGFFFALWDIAR